MRVFVQGGSLHNEGIFTVGVIVQWGLMFIEGLYLHTIIVFAFSTGQRLFYSCVAIGWGQITPALCLHCVVLNAFMAVAIDTVFHCTLELTIVPLCYGTGATCKKNI